MQDTVRLRLPSEDLSVQKLALLVVATLVSATFARAQDTPAGEIYGGYQYTRIDTHAVQDALNLEHVLDPTFPLVDFGAHQNLNGWNFGVQENMNSWFGAVVDISGSYGTKSLTVLSSSGVTVKTRTRLRSHTFMGGPQLTLRRSSRFQPFGRALLGGAWYSDSTNVLANNVPLFAELKEGDSGFALGGGGGTDISFSPHLGVRVTVDYIRTFFFNDSQGNIRSTFGLIYRFGAR